MVEKEVDEGVGTHKAVLVFLGEEREKKNLFFFLKGDLHLESLVYTHTGIYYY